MDRYQRVEKPRPETTIKENEIRITTQGLIRNYISYATSLLQEKRVREIVLKAMGQAISKTVAIAEIIKKKIPGLHQDTTISSTSITDVWEPIEEGLVPLEMTRHVSMISISLSIKEQNKNSPGYQPPLYVEQPKTQYQQQPQYQQQQHQLKQAPGPIAGPSDDSYGWGRGRGRGRGRGWGRGGYNNYQENGGWNYDNWNRGGGRGRGWGHQGGYERGKSGVGGYERGRGGVGGYERGRGGGVGGYERGRGGVGGYERGRDGVGGRGYIRGRGRMGGGRGRGGVKQA